MKHKHKFELKAPDAHNVLLVGDFTQWQDSPVPMKRRKNGDWEASIKLEPGSYGYRYIVDDRWMDDPACEHNSPNPYGGQNAVVQIS